MKPDQRWFPTSRTERAAWFQNFAGKFAEIGLSLGFTQAEIDAVAADNAVVQYAASYLTSLEANMNAARKFERLITQGPNNGTEPHMPVPNLPAPPPMVTSGIYERLARLVARIRVAPTYNTSVGTLLGVVRSGNTSKLTNNYVPEQKVWVEGANYSFSVRCTVGEFDGFQVSYRRADGQRWETANTFTRSPAQVRVIPSAPGQPEQISVRVRMVKANEPVAQYSSMASITLTP